MRSFRNPRYAPEGLERKLNPSGISIPVAAEFAPVAGVETGQATAPQDLGQPRTMSARMATSSAEPPPVEPSPEPAPTPAPDPSPSQGDPPWEQPADPTGPMEPSA